MKSLLLSVSLALAALLFPRSSAAEPQTSLITKPGKVLLSEDFSGAQIPPNWQPGGHPNSFSIVDGALQGVCSPEDAHGPAIGVPIDAHNITIRFSVKLAKGLLLFLVDGESQFGGQAHLLRVALDSKNATLQQDRGSLESKQAQAAEKQAAAKDGRKPATPTPEQLADPKFYRTETLDRKPARVTDGEWHRVLVEINGNDAVAQVDDQVVLRATGSVFDVKKSRLVFLIGLAGSMLIDDVEVRENTPAAASTSPKGAQFRDPEYLDKRSRDSLAAQTLPASIP